MARPSKRSSLATLSRARLLEVSTGFELEVRTSANKAELVDAVAHSKRASFERVLELLMRDELQEICRAHGLDDPGKVKQAIVERILGKKAAPQLPGGVRRRGPGRCARRPDRADARVGARWAPPQSGPRAGSGLPGRRRGARRRFDDEILDRLFVLNAGRAGDEHLLGMRAQEGPRGG